MLEELSVNEAVNLLLLGNIDFGLIVKTETLGIIFENLKVRDGKCYFINQTDSVLQVWADTSARARIILEGDPSVWPSTWEKILKIYIINEE